MAKVTVHGFTALAHRVQRWGVQAMMDEVVATVADTLVDDMRQTVSSTATGKDWVTDSQGRTLSQMFNPASKRYGSHDGRIDSGNMFDKIRASQKVLNNTEVVYEVGWPEGSPEYFRAQEYGFRHWITGQHIQGMNALASAKDIGADLLQIELNKAVRDMLRG